jgi:gas vesicle protein
MSKNNKSVAFIGGMLVGSAIGVVLGLLVAPRTGKETRRILQKTAEALPSMAEDLSTTVQLNADRLSESALSNWEQTLTRLKAAIAAGVEASQIEVKNQVIDD